MNKYNVEIRPIWSTGDWPDPLPLELKPYLQTNRQIPILIATRHSLIIGWSVSRDKSSEICAFFVHADYRRKGIGSRLFRCLTRRLMDYGTTEITLAPSLPMSASRDAILNSFSLASNKNDSSPIHLNGLIPPDLKDLSDRNRNLSIPIDYGIKRALHLHYDATELTSIGLDCFQRPQRMFPQAAAAWTLMQYAASMEGINLTAVSAFRSCSYQHDLIQRKLNANQCIDEILKVSAAPGYSEHHTGRALDITDGASKPLETEFAQTKAYQWLGQNAADYSFYLSYPRENPHAIAWEPWHWCWHKTQPASDH